MDFAHEDFDVTITEVVLVHRFHYVKDECYGVYARGRKISGIVYCLSGNALYSFEDAQIILHPNESIFLPENSAYTVRCLGDEAFRHITANFNMYSGEPTHFPSEDFNMIAEDMIVSDRGEIKELLLSLVEIWEKKKRGYRVLAKAIVYELVYRYFILLGRKFHDDNYMKILPAKRLLDEEYNRNIPVSELAQLCGFSQTHFRRLFTEVLHSSPTEYRLNKRILHAKDFLLTGEYSISEVAALVGFEDANYFSRVFKAYTNMSPSEYIR